MHAKGNHYFSQFYFVSKKHVYRHVCVIRHVLKSTKNFVEPVLALNFMSVVGIKLGSIGLHNKLFT